MYMYMYVMDLADVEDHIIMLFMHMYTTYIKLYMRIYMYMYMLSIVSVQVTM